MRANVWAPHAEDVQLALGSGDDAETISLDPGLDGWWEGPRLSHGTDYAYLIDGEGPFPDPRSAAQPAGVHGPSQAFDSGIHAWSDQAWRGGSALGAVFYELHVGTFTAQGTLDAAARQLPALRELGVDIVELMPVAPFPGARGWGYDGVALYGVHAAYGGPAALQRFVDAAHQADLGVCLDVVYNHLGPDGNYLSKYGPYFTDAHDTPWGWAVNLDQQDSSQVRRFLIDNALRWFSDFHIDALRLDAVHELKDDSERHVLAQMSDEVAELAIAIGRPLSLVAESDLNDVRMITPTSEGGHGMTAQWADDVHHALHAYLTGERHGYYVDFGSLEVLDKAFREAFVHDGSYSTFRERDWGTPVPSDIDRRQFVVFASNHDQVGNRALGDRPSSRLTTGAQAASLALILLSPFTPMLFMGEEYGETRPFLFFTDHDEPLGTAVSNGRMSEFAGHGWDDLYGGRVDVPDPQERTTYLRSMLGDGLASDSHGHRALRGWLAEVMAARDLTQDRAAWQRHPVGVSEVAPRVLTMRGPVIVHANLTDAPVTIDSASPRTVFGSVTHSSEGLVLEPDTVILVDADQSPTPGSSKGP